MKIDSIKINGFGKLKNKEIEFKDGINIVYGENESGKSTILKFISSMLYGVSKNKNGKKIADFEQYKPWEDTGFSGKMKYSIGNYTYEVFREFKKKNPEIYNQFGDNISKEFKADKSKGINFFEEQTGVDENSFLNTSIIEQNAVKLEKSDTNIVIQKISNLVSTGDDNISFKKSLEKINKMQIESIGTDRTKNKPINIVEENIKKLSEEKKELVRYKDNLISHSENKEKIDYELKQENVKRDFLKDVKKYLDDSKLEKAEMNFEQKLEKESKDKLNEIKEKMSQNPSKTKNDGVNTKKKILIGLFIILIILVSIFGIWKKNALTIIPASIFLVVILMIVKKNHQDYKVDDSSQYFINQYEIALQEYNERKQAIEQKEKSFLERDNSIKNLILEQYKEQLDTRFIESNINQDILQIENELELVENRINDLKLQNHMLDSKKENIDEKLEKLAKIEEELENQKNIKFELDSLNTSFNIAKECLENAYEEIKHNISPKFEQNLCEIISNITDGKYNNVSVNDESGLKVEVENGAYVPADRLSVGTIDEMYLALRLSMLSEITEEKLPILFDETFAYFDNNRLKNVLCYLQDKNYDNQVIIFTCSNREENALKELKIEYNLINLEK